MCCAKEWENKAIQQGRLHLNGHCCCMCGMGGEGECQAKADALNKEEAHRLGMRERALDRACA
eukprot:462-Pleurochrysis_carterae.AAC.1